MVRTTGRPRAAPLASDYPFACAGCHRRVHENTSLPKDVTHGTAVGLVDTLTCPTDWLPRGIEGRACSRRLRSCQDRIRPVSYTHLRAHETRHDLVCRLLLEKKK